MSERYMTVNYYQQSQILEQIARTRGRTFPRNKQSQCVSHKSLKTIEIEGLVSCITKIHQATSFAITLQLLSIDRREIRSNIHRIGADDPKN